ncbi:HEAT repeat domain-containing protein [Novosphingobium aquimarinum]|uniref:HEAT repeat domain-containing protein n=1 Tax=Novosphingobium aquimarinum TaxID=2682494 RepID=UPI0012EC83B2|nr:HEAT repeat domain-containing protein [Novosphingobium aquimarinum]
MVQAVTYISAVISLAMSAYMAWLILRRWRDERTASRREAIQRDITRHYLQHCAGGAQADETAPKAAWSRAARLQAVTHLLKLLRGEEGQRLLRLVESEGLFDAALVRTQNPRPTARVIAIRMLEGFGSRLCTDALATVMATDPAPSVRLEAAGALARLDRLPSLRDTISLLNLYETPPTPLHRAIMRSLAPVRTPEILDVLDGDLPAQLRMLLIDALGWSGQLDVLATLCEASRDEHPLVRNAALQATAQLGHAGRGEWVIAMLRDHDESVRARAAKVCSALGLRQAIEELLRLEQDSSRWVAMQAGQALARLKPAAPAQKRA